MKKSNQDILMNKLFLIVIVFITLLSGKENHIQIAKDISYISAPLLYEVDYNKLKISLKELIETNRDIAGITIIDQLSGQVVFKVFKVEGKTIYNKQIPDSTLDLNYIELKSLYDKQVVGDVVVYFNDLSKLKLTNNEIEYLKNKKIIKMCNKQGRAPIEFKNKNNEFEGIVTNTMKLLSEKIANDVTFESVESDDCNISQNYLKEKKCDIIPAIGYSKQKENIGNYTEPYLDYKAMIITRNDEPFLNNIENIVDKGIAIKKGSLLNKKIKKLYPNIKIVEVEDYKDSFLKVSTGEIYATIALAPIATYNIEKYGLNNLKIAGYVEIPSSLSILVNKDDKILHSILNKALKSITPNERKTILDNYISIQLDQKTNKSIVRLILLVSTVIIIGVLILLFIVNYAKKKLQDTVNEQVTQIINQKKGLEQSIIEVENSKRFIRKIIDTVPVRIFWKDRDNKYLGANKLFLQDGGLESEDEIIGKTDLDMIWKSNAQAFIDDDSDVMNSGKAKMLIEEQLPLKDGKIKYLLTSKVPLFDFYGKVYGILGTFYDITEQKLAQEKLEQKNKILLEQSKLASMGEMIGNIAHQWRQPLSVISTGATGLKVSQEFGTLTNEELVMMCDAINDNAQYLSKTIDDFRDFIKGDRKKVDFNLSINVESFLHLVEGTIKNNDIHVVQNIVDNITISSYPNELIQCFINIFNNAKDALKNIEEEKLFFISTNLEDDKVYITFKDNAGGIAQDVISHIFEPYFTTKHPSKGTGLGLNMTYNLIVDGMRGTIEVTNSTYEYEANEYTGAEFTITLPLS